MKLNKKPGRIGRKRRAAGWTLLVLGVLVAGVWAASRCWKVEYFFPSGHYWLANGKVTVRSVTSTRELRGETRWELERADFTGWFWWYGFSSDELETRSGLYTFMHIQKNAWTWDTWHRLLIWPIPLLLWTPAALLLRSGLLARRRAMTNTCTKCGYSLAGLGKDAACPECGKSRTE